MAILRTVEDLESVYGHPKGAAVFKEITFLNAHYRTFVEAAPFVVLASAGEGGLDCSPKGDVAGFVRVLDERTLAIPDRPGNNRIDNLRNIIIDPRVSLLFIVPGIGETLRVNGRAEISTDPELLASFAVDGRPPRTVILVSVDVAYVHCSKAVMRSRLWDPSRHRERSELPSLGAMVALLSDNAIDGAAYDRELPERLKATLY